ncbi:MAG: hypothetical protein NTZ78_03415, partial [Candidatus Aureabacteria bacterium]|nr:hypothetical protein [Candidatus Auribacterota bacterium]
VSACFVASLLSTGQGGGQQASCRGTQFPFPSLGLRDRLSHNDVIMGTSPCLNPPLALRVYITSLCETTPAFTRS